MSDHREDALRLLVGDPLSPRQAFDRLPWGRPMTRSAGPRIPGTVVAAAPPNVRMALHRLTSDDLNDRDEVVRSVIPPLTLIERIKLRR